MIPPTPQAIIDRWAPQGPLVVLTGAGVSAESGIPTFRGKEGYWTVGAREYHPQELATHEAFVAMPDEVWAWYLYRRGVCHAAQPNAGHQALVELEALLSDAFLLVTQNVDGLHRRAGSSEGKLYEIHGRIDQMRCARECTDRRFEMPPGVDLAWEKGRKLDDATRALLVCPLCGSPSRPHVLWFDESYDEARYRFQSSLRAAREAALLVVVGTSGATNLPHQMVSTVARNGRGLLVVNADPSPFTELAESIPSGAFWPTPSAAALPALVAQMRIAGAR
jgi:NAD-dependent deacetylase